MKNPTLMMTLSAVVLTTTAAVYSIKLCFTYSTSHPRLLIGSARIVRVAYRITW